MSEFENNEYMYEGSANEPVAGGSKKRRKPAKKKDNKLAVAAVAIITAFIVFVVLLVIQDRIVNQGMTQPVVVAIAEIPRGTVLTQENMPNYLAVEQRDVEEVPAWITYSNGTPLIGLVTDRDIHVKEIITDSCFVENDFYDDIVDPVELAIEVSDIGQAVAGILRPGDLIDIKAVIQVEKQTESASADGSVTNVDDVPTLGLLEPPVITDEGLMSLNPEDAAGYDEAAEDVTLEEPQVEVITENEAVVLDMDGNVLTNPNLALTYGVTGEYVTQTIAEDVRVVGVYTSGGETTEKVEAAGETMVATVINVVVPRSLQDTIYLAMEEGTIRLARVEAQKNEVGNFVDEGASVDVEEIVGDEATATVDDTTAQ